MNEGSGIKRVVIVGGGTAGWIAAVEMAHLIPDIYQEVVLIESPDIGTIGVGEATIPPFVSFLRALELDEVDFIRATQATFKLAIQFDDWSSVGENYLHPFGSIGAKIDGQDFYHYWLKARRQGDAADLYDYSAAAVMCKKERFFLPFKVPPQSPIASANYALHLDAVLAAKYFREYAVARGVLRVEANVGSVVLADSGDIDHLLLENGERVEGDFFIDCTGFKALLIGKAMSVTYQDWSNFLPCNRAVAMQTENVADPKPYTVSHARAAGWSWHIPLQHRTGNGYVYCSDFISDDEAIATLRGVVQGKPVNDPRIIPFLTGKRQQIWHKNCLALGLASGFLEPLESTAIHLINQGIQYFLDLRPDLEVNEAKQAQYNAFMDERYLEIRDFLVLHYCTTKRDDTPFWRHCKNMPVPESLTARMQQFIDQGDLYTDKNALFSKDSWLSVLHGMGLQPKTHKSHADKVDYAALKAFLQSGQATIQQSVVDLPTHKAFIQQYCAAPMPAATSTAD